jgi:hypothetical protein
MYILLQYIFPEKEAESILVEAREDSNPKVLKEAEGIVKYSRIRFPAKRFIFNLYKNYNPSYLINTKK